KPSGSSAVGVSVLSIRGSINDVANPEVDLRLDSGADITLVSAEYFNSLERPPKLRQGRKMELWQLTDKSSKIEGYVELPLFVRSKSGDTVGLMAEAYVVPGMNVSILLGEDFHLAYELTVARHLEFGTTVRLAESGLEFEAKGNRRWRRSRAAKKQARTAVVAEDVRIPPHTCVNVAVNCSFEDSDVWLVEKAMVGDDRVVPLVIPNVLIGRDYARVPVTNTTTRTRWLRKGETLADLRDPRAYFDQPRSAKHWAEMATGADRIAALSSVLREVN
ncbi:hypothetical protein BC629DRAFT_1257812, partial [Irpex lacteus]